jgi:HlyD family secretion protein
MSKVLEPEITPPVPMPESTTESAIFQGNQPRPQPVRIWMLSLGIGIGIALTLVGTKLFSSAPPAAKPPASPAKTADRGIAQSVTAATVNYSRLNRTLKATGTVAPLESVSVLAQATGLQIRQILVDEGQFVRAGQVLAVLDDSTQRAKILQAEAAVVAAEARLAELKAGSRKEEISRARESLRRIESEIAQAKSDLDLARKRVQRNETLEAEGAIAQDRLDEFLNDERNKRALVEQAKALLREAQQQLALLEAGPRREVIAQTAAQLAEAKASLQTARIELDKTRVVAPASGKIAKRNARVGQTTTSFSQTPLFEIIENGRLELQVKIPETQLAAIRPGQVVEITSDADSRLKLRGQVREINPTVDTESRQGTVKVELPQNSTLKPGMFLRAGIVTAESTSLTVPMGAILPQADGSAIAYQVKPDGTVKAQTVEIGEILSNQQIEIKRGLQAGERVVVKGAAYLKEGDRVSVASDL